MLNSKAQNDHSADSHHGIINLKVQSETTEMAPTESKASTARKGARMRNGPLSPPRAALGSHDEPQLLQQQDQSWLDARSLNARRHSDNYNSAEHDTDSPARPGTVHESKLSADAFPNIYVKRDVQPGSPKGAGRASKGQVKKVNSQVCKE